MRISFVLSAALMVGALVCGPAHAQSNPWSTSAYPTDTPGAFATSMTMGYYNPATNRFVPCTPSTCSFAGVASGSGGGGSVALAPVAPSATSVATGGTAVTVFAAGAVSSCQVTNPTTATENLILSAYGAATTTGGGTSRTLVPGQSWSCPGVLTTAVSVNAATSGHTFEAEGFK